MIEISPQLQHFGTAYTEFKFWAPLLTAITLVWKAKGALTGYMDALMTNHLSHIQAATVETVAETKKTNSLLEDHTEKLVMVQNTMRDHNEKEMQVWTGIVNTLAVLEDRTRRSPSRKAAHAKR